MFDSYTHRRARKTWGAFLCVFAILITIPFIGTADEGDTWIVFDSNRPNPEATERTYWDIWKLDPDARNWEQTGADCDLFGDPLTNDPANEWDPTYSVHDKCRVEDGAVIFVSDRDGYPHLYKISIDGGFWIPLFDAHIDEYATVDPCYNFSGDLVAYASNQDGNWEIYTMEPDRNAQPHQVTHTPDWCDNRSPCFSTDGNTIYFVSNYDNGPSGDGCTGFGEIYSINLDGTGMQKVIVDEYDNPLLLDYQECDPCCSPVDDDILVFATNFPTSTYSTEDDRINFELFSFSFTTKEITRLTASWNEHYDDGKIYELWNSTMPCFHPNGQKIVWSASNWTNVPWRESYPYQPSYWRPGDRGQGASQQIWIRGTNQTADEHNRWFPPSFWGYSESGPGGGHWNGGHQHHQHFNPSWDYKPGCIP